MAGLAELGEDAPDLAPRDIDCVGDGGGGEPVAQPASGLRDLRRGVAPGLNDIGAADDREVLTKGASPASGVSSG